MKTRLTSLAVLFLLAASCTDDHRPKTSSSLVTAPTRPALTMKTLPSNASTVCVATVRKRDQLLAKNPAADHSALDASIDDICQ